MQVIRKSIQQPIGWARLSGVFQQIRLQGSDPRSSTSADNHQGGQKDSNLNKSKGGNKKQRSTETDDTDQPGTKRQDWSQPNKMVGNDPQYGKGGRPQKE